MYNNHSYSTGKTLFGILLCFVLIATSHAQTILTNGSGQQQQGNGPGGKKIVSATKFPLGALVAGDIPLDSLQNLFLNTAAYFHNANNDQIGDARDTLGAVGGGGFLEKYRSFNEQRCYFFSGYNTTNDRKYDYAANKEYYTQVAAYWYRVVGDTNGGEFRIDTSTSPLSAINSEENNAGYKGNYLLRQPLWQIFGDVNTDPINYAYYCDFIYRFNTFDQSYINAGTNDTLYYIDIWVKGAKQHSKYSTDNKWLKYDTIFTFAITKQIYENSLSTSNDSNWWNNDLEHSLNKFRDLSQSGIVLRDYARLHMVLDSALMYHYYRDGLSGDSSSYLRSKYVNGDTLGHADVKGHRDFVRFDVRLRRNPNNLVPIYVKGIRTRNGGAEKLLTGQLDGELLYRFNKIKDSKYLQWNGSSFDTATGNYYNNLINIHTEPEPYPDRYYIIGYLDRFARDNGFKRLTSFTPFFAREHRLIWDDILWKSDMTDAAPEHLYRNVDYVSGPFSWLPLPQDVLSKNQQSGLNMFQQPIASRSDHKQYELIHDSVFRLGFRNLMQEANQAAFSVGAKSVPFWIMGQAYVGFTYRSGSDLNNFRYADRKHIDSIKNYVVPIIKANMLNSTKDCYSQGYQTSVNYWAYDANKLYDTSTIGFDRANVSAEMIRLQANIAAAWGAKGFTVSNAGSNGLRDIGFSNIGYDVATDEWSSSKALFLGNDFYLNDTAGMHYVVHKDDPDSVNNNWFTTIPNLSGYIYVSSPCDNTVRHKIYPYVGSNYCISRCTPSISLWSYLPTFYGFKTRYRGVQKAMGDLNRVADKALAKLTWIAAVDVSGRDATIPASYQDSLPIKDISSVIQKKKRMINETDKSYIDSLSSGQKVVDADNERLVEVGVFKDTADKSARYVYLVNRRVWANRPVSDALTDASYLGNVAVRRIQLKVKPQLFGVDSIASLWQITDVASGKDILLHKDSIFSFIAEPGEGQLFRIAPSVASSLGDMATNTFNNGRHIAAIETASVQYVATYQRNGNIVVSYPVETPGASTERHADNPVDVVIATQPPNGTNLNPAIAYDPNDSTVGIIYQTSISSVDPNFDSVDVFIQYQSANLASKTTFSSPVTIDTFRAKKGFLATPAIAPHHSSDFHFWLAWRHPRDGAGIGILDKDDALLTTGYLADSDPKKTKFPSIATHSQASDSVYVAVEEGTDNNSNIFTGAVWYDDGNNTLHSSPQRNISKGHGYCSHHHPQITVTKDRYVGVVWDAVNKMAISTPNLGSFKVQTTHNVVYRSRDPLGSWSKFITIQAFIKPSTLTTDTMSTYPTIGIATDTVSPSATKWRDYVRYMWNNPITNMVGITRMGHGENFNRIVYKIYDLKAPSLEPAMPMLTSGDQVVHPLLYRSPFAKDGNGLYDTKVTHFDFPITDVQAPQSKVVRLILAPLGLCSNVTGTIGKVHIAHVDTTSTLDSLNFNLTPQTISSPFDTSQKPLKWGEIRLRTENFTFIYQDTIQYDRYFNVGEYSVGDTATAAESLVDTSDFVRIRVVLRNATNNAKIAVLDSCILRKAYYHQTGGEYGLIGKVYVAPMTYVDSVYLSFEPDRKDSTNSFELGCDFAYVEGILDGIPEDVPAYKAASTANPVPVISNVDNHSIIDLRITPNPFEVETAIEIGIPRETPFSVAVFDILGRTNVSLFDGISDRDKFSFTLNSKTLSPGIYFVRVQAGNEVRTQRIQLIK